MITVPWELSIRAMNSPKKIRNIWLAKQKFTIWMNKLLNSNLMFLILDNAKKNQPMRILKFKEELMLRVQRMPNWLASSETSKWRSRPRKTKSLSSATVSMLPDNATLHHSIITPTCKQKWKDSVTTSQLSLPKTSHYQWNSILFQLLTRPWDTNLTEDTESEKWWKPTIIQSLTLKIILNTPKLSADPQWDIKSLSLDQVFTANKFCIQDLNKELLRKEEPQLNGELRDHLKEDMSVTELRPSEFTQDITHTQKVINHQDH